MCYSNKRSGYALYMTGNKTYIINHTYVNIDIVNAHPNILYQICKYNGIECENLYEYINNHDNI